MRLAPLVAGLLLLVSPLSAQQISGQIRPFGIDSASPSAPLYGFVADSQLQTRLVGLNESWLRGARQDESITVTLRPPALDWASRPMLREYLQELRDRGAVAIFYLGDGANNGCHDEFLGGFADGSDPAQPGVLRLLADARRDLDRPIFYVLGNHDYLAAGNASGDKERHKLCRDRDEQTPNEPATKWDVIAAVDKFNRESAAGTYDFKAIYRSVLDSRPEALRSNCFGPKNKASGQQRRRGCYLAATLDHVERSGRTIQFQLLDTGDFSDVSWAGSGNYEIEGTRGSMSFKVLKDGVTPQTKWFQEHAVVPVDLRIALTHYPFGDLKRLIKGSFSLSSKLGRPMDLFHSEGKSLQTSAYVISAHTHTPFDKTASITINLDCGLLPGSCGSQQALFRELNIGSTTDYRTGATLVRFSPGGLGSTSAHDMEFRELKLTEDRCGSVYARAAKLDVNTEFGIDPDHPFNYREFDASRRKAIYVALDRFAGSDQLAGWCIGLWASRLEGFQL